MTGGGSSGSDYDSGGGSESGAGSISGSGGAGPLERYRRQMQIPGWNGKIQKKLDCAHVTVAGAGGLGSPVLLYLAAAGVGELHLIDGGRVSLANLNRQILYHEGDIGRSKARTAAFRLSEFNSGIHIDCTADYLREENIERTLSPTSLIVDCLDTYDDRFLLNRYAVQHRIPLVHGGIHGFNGQMTTIIPGETPCLECLYAGMQDERDDSGRPRQTPVAGAVAGVIGSLQAMEVIKFITGFGDLCTNRLLIYDGIGGRMDEIGINRDKNCALCGALGKNGV
jgi:adenylyltransferase/sulfurtransferase